MLSPFHFFESSWVNDPGHLALFEFAKLLLENVFHDLLECLVDQNLHHQLMFKLAAEHQELLK